MKIGLIELLVVFTGYLAWLVIHPFWTEFPNKPPRPLVAEQPGRLSFTHFGELPSSV